MTSGWVKKVGTWQCCMRKSGLPEFGNLDYQNLAKGFRLNLKEKHPDCEKWISNTSMLEPSRTGVYWKKGAGWGSACAATKAISNFGMEDFGLNHSYKEAPIHHRVVRCILLLRCPSSQVLLSECTGKHKARRPP